MKPETAKYFERTGEHTGELKYASEEDVKAAIVIPALKEFDNISELLSSLLKNDPEEMKDFLVLFIVNNLKSSADDIKQDNLRTLEFLDGLITGSSTCGIADGLKRSKLKLGYIDAATPGNELEEKHGGVGLARKTGMDTALFKFGAEAPEKFYLFCLDGDCTVSGDYLSILNSVRNTGAEAGALEYSHPLTGVGEQDAAIICYEIFLRYYAAGLTYANSPYAFHNIGSTMFCRGDAYIKAGGMNKRKAAEDFYFMQKLAKMYNITVPDKTAVFPSPRPSFRVPFGTGQRVSRFLEHERNEYLLYAPQSFLILRSWLRLFNSVDDPDELLADAEKTDEQLLNFLEMNNFCEEWERVMQHSNSDEQRSKQKRFWFDGFRTLKFIHHLRDNGYPDINMFDAADTLIEKTGTRQIRRNSEIPPLDTQIKYIESLKIITKRNKG